MVQKISCATVYHTEASARSKHIQKFFMSLSPDLGPDLDFENWLRTMMAHFSHNRACWACWNFLTTPCPYSMILSIYLHFREALDHAISSCLVPLYHLMPEHPFIWIKAFIAALRDRRNRTSAASSASNRFIHCTNALLKMSWRKSKELVSFSLCKIWKKLIEC